MNKLVLGTVQFGLDYGINNQSGQVPLSEVSEILQHCRSANLLMLDTAAAYGETERILGEAYPELGRDFKVVTKLRAGITPEVFQQELSKSLGYLRSEKLYGLLFHNFNDFYDDPTGFMEVIEPLKTAGTIQKIGFSVYSELQLEWLLQNDFPTDLVQAPFSLFDKRFEPYFGPLKYKFNTEIHVRSVFLQGLYFMQPDQLPANLTVFKKPLEELRAFAEAVESDIATIAMTVPALHPHIDGVLVGVDSLEQLKQNLKAYSESDPEFLNYPFKPIDFYYLNPSNWKNESR